MVDWKLLCTILIAVVLIVLIVILVVMLLEKKADRMYPQHNAPPSNSRSFIPPLARNERFVKTRSGESSMTQFINGYINAEIGNWRSKQ